MTTDVGRHAGGEYKLTMVSHECLPYLTKVVWYNTIMIFELITHQYTKKGFHVWGSDHVYLMFLGSRNPNEIKKNSMSGFRHIT